MDDEQLKVKDVSCGYGFTVFICQHNTTKQYLVYGTGLNSDSQLGYHLLPNKSVMDCLIQPHKINLPLLHPESTAVTHIACGRAHTVIATDKEGIFTLGNNSYGQCGRPIIEQEIFKGSQAVHRIDFNKAIKQVVCGQDHTLVLTESGNVYSCGLSTDGQTGVGHFNCCGQLTQVQGDIAHEKIIHISSKGDTILAVSDKGELFGWGNTEYCQLSVVDNTTTQINLPRHLPFKSVGHVISAAAAGSLCSVLNREGEIFVWGYGILGKGPNLEMTDTPQSIPVSLFGQSEYDPELKVTSISSGLFHLTALNDRGDLYVWGKNRGSCLGLGHVLDQYFPYQVQVPAEVKSVSCGVDHMIVTCQSFV